MMKEILITSSALILALLVIRQLFRGVLSRRVQYALWALVLVRLLVPVSLPAADFSVLTATAPVQQAVAHRLPPPEPVFVPVAQQPLSQHPTAPDTAPELAISPDESHVWVADTDETAVQYRKLTAQQVLTFVWAAGMAVVGGFFLVSNLAFWLKLRSRRRVWEAAPYHGVRKVYVVEEGVIPSPCLFGRSIYITSSLALDSEKLRHVLTHEATHAKHLDPLWALLRCVCLTIYWFDPLVWVAAACSRTDCELACDESVLRALGEEERIPYGQTLLSLIPVKRVGNPLLTATTMAAGKKQLTDRITRIARGSRQLLAAALAVAVLAGVVSACTFTGAKVTSSPAPEGGLRALTGQELQWFNTQFFNNQNSDNFSYNIRNQFANPTILYDRPEDIDLYELFYCEPGSDITDYEIKTVFEYDNWDDMPCPAYKITDQWMDERLKEYTGLTLEETNKVGLDDFTHSSEFDAYFWMHGDTNYCGWLDFTNGTREGDTVKLYHNSAFAGSGWYCVTLTANGGDDYLFVSNQACEEPPAFPIALPQGEPAITMDLTGLEPYAAPTVLMELNVGDFIDSPDYRLANWDIGGHNVVVYRSSTQADTVRAAIRWSDGTMNVFFTVEESNYRDMFFFLDLFGQEGFTISYYGQTAGNAYGTLVDYYTISSDGIPALLCRTNNGFEQPMVVDLDGDGQNELATEYELFFQREGKLYRADLRKELLAAWPELSYWDFGSWDKYARCMAVTGLTDHAMWERHLYFDGERLLAYAPEKTTTDHVVDGAVEKYGVPDEVVQAAKDHAQVAYKRSDPGPDAPIYDDWRVESFSGFCSEEFGNTVIEGWAFNYELHTTTPEKVVLAGGRYITEDGWVSPGYPGCDWLFFKLSGTMNEKREFLWTEMNQSSPGSWGFRNDIIQNLEKLDVELEGTTVANLRAEQALAHILDHTDLVQLVLSTPDGKGGTYQVPAGEGNEGYYRNYFSDPGSYTWTKVDTPAQAPTGTTLIIADGVW